MKRHTRPIDRIVIHCAATPAGRDVTVAEIRRWHVEERGWDDIGYHWVVGLDGSVWPGREEAWQGAHVAGHNNGSIGVCYVGGTDGRGDPADTRTPEQRRVLPELLEAIAARHGHVGEDGRRRRALFGHRDLDEGKACPSFDVAQDYGRAVAERPAAET